MSKKIQIRLTFIGVVTMIVFAVLLSRLWFLQVVAGDEFARKAEENRVQLISVDAPRGSIIDRNGEILVNNRPSLAVVLLSEASETQGKVISRLSRILGMSVQQIEEKLRREKSGPFAPRVIKRDVDEQIITFIKERQADFPGVKIAVESVRQYPDTTLAAHALGYLGEISEEELKKPEYQPHTLGDIIGKSGLERQFESFLRGKKGEQRLEVNATGQPLRILSEKNPTPGHNLILTLDKTIQKATEVGLEEAIKNARRQKYKKAAAGAAVVMDPRNGEVLALASYPTYDPRLFLGGITTKDWQALNDRTSNYPLYNRAIMSAYPPASTFKPLTGLAALAEGITTPKTRYLCLGRWSKMGERWVKYCWKRSGHGNLNFNWGVIWSCDIVFYEIGYKFYKAGGEKLQEWSRQFGLGSPTGIDLPSETGGRVPDKVWKRQRQNQPWVPGDTVNMAIGQGDLLMTPLQLANVYSVIANGGTLFKPIIVKKVLTYNGEMVQEFKSEELRKLPLPPAAIKIMQQNLEKVITVGTAASAFANFPVPVAGKTGTAQVLGKDDYAWFASYAPAGNPQYVVVVVVEQGGYGGSTAAPAARQILGNIFKVDPALVTAPNNVVDFSR